MPEPTEQTVKAIVFRRPGVAWARQVRICLRFAEQHHYRVESIVRSIDDALALIRQRVAEVLIAAMDAPGDEELVAQVLAAGGRMEYCRPPRYRHDDAPLTASNTVDVTLRLHDLAESAESIAAVLGRPLERIVEILRRFRP